MTIYSRHGTVKFSDEISAHMGLYNETNYTRSCFIGDFSSYDDEGGWKGDDVNVRARHGSVKVWFVDEVDPQACPTNCKSGGFFARVFSF
jgi:hypothetical protein